jgi:branched-chain amino acid transport system substrate-binding protein
VTWNTPVISTPVAPLVSSIRDVWRLRRTVIRRIHQTCEDSMIMISQRSRATAVVSLAVASALTLSACGGGESSGGSGGDATYKVGVLLGLTGPYAAVAEPQQRAMKLFEKQVDAAGGIDGHEIDFVYLDSKSSESEAVNQLRRFATQENVVAVIGPSASGEGIALKPIAQSLKVPVIAPVSSVDIAEPAVPYMYKNFLAAGDSMTAQLEYVKSQGMTKVAMLSSNNAYGQEPAAQLEKVADGLGLDVVASETFAPDATDMTSQLSVIERANPEVVLVWSVSPSNAIIAKNAKAMNFKPLIFQGPGAGSLGYLSLAGDAANGTIVQAGKILVADDIPDADPQKKAIAEYVKAWKAEYKDEPSQFDAGAWDSALILKKAIEEMKGAPSGVPAVRTAIEESLESNIKDLPGVGAVTTFTKKVHGPTGSKELAILGVENGAFTLLKINE